MLLFFLPLLASMRCWCCCFVLQGDAALAAPASSAVLASQSEGGVSGLLGHSSADFKSGEEVVDSNATSMPQAMAKAAAPVAVGSEASAMTPHHNPHHPRPRLLLQPPPPRARPPLWALPSPSRGPARRDSPHRRRRPLMRERNTTAGRVAAFRDTRRREGSR